MHRFSYHNRSGYKCRKTSLVHCLQSNRSSSNALRAQDSSDPAFDKQHIDPASHEEVSPLGSGAHADSETGKGPPGRVATHLDASLEQGGTQPDIGSAGEQGDSPTAGQNRQSQDGMKGEGAGFTAADEAAHADTDGRTAHLASLAEQADIRQVLWKLQ